MLNDALFYDSYEIIGGKKFMSPSANPYHNNVMGRLYNILSTYVHDKKCGYVFTDSMDVHLPDGNLFKPDLSVVKIENASIINWHKAIYGAPDMVVEVLSRSTRKRDVTVKKDIYESNGVKEYWVIDPFVKAVDVYTLIDGKFYFNDSYVKFTQEEFNDLTDAEKAEVKTDIRVGIFEDLVINVADIFSWDFNT